MLVVASVPSKIGWDFIKMPEKNRKLAAWMDFHMTKRRLSQNALAEITGIGLTTINRYCDPNNESEPRTNFVLKLARYFGDRPPIDMDPGDGADFAEDGVEPVPVEPGVDTPANLTEWAVRDSSMQVMGYMPGDLVWADANITAKDGDVVVCNLFSLGNRPARNALRMFRAPSYLISATSDSKELEIHEVGKTAAIYGVIFESRRLRKAS